jgi:hypothetical protein
MSNGFACHLVGGTKQLQLSASGKVLYHEIARWGAGSISWLNGAPRLGGASHLGQDKIRDLSTTLVVQLMVEEGAFTASAPTDVARRALPTFARYREPSHCRSIFEIAVTLVPFVALWALAWAAVHFGYWELSFLLGVPAAGFVVRLFMIQHDCGHGSFFRYRLANDWVAGFWVF